MATATVPSSTRGQPEAMTSALGRDLGIVSASFAAAPFPKMNVVNLRGDLLHLQPLEVTAAALLNSAEGLALPVRIHVDAMSADGGVLAAGIVAAAGASFAAAFRQNGTVDALNIAGATLLMLLMRDAAVFALHVCYLR